jgi:hypothetical protein
MLLFAGEKNKSYSGIYNNLLNELIVMLLRILKQNYVVVIALQKSELAAATLQ